MREVMFEDIKGFLFTVRWHWKNRNWKPTRQKQKAFDRDYSKYMKKVRVNINGKGYEK